ncbi:hypothetical protein EVAR_26108_1 [Eumeta japonica]|uniref:Uncharacterized protein n=1 Tax=Eumeta variegata TaxID=151549 RepID=A0A4C1X1E4_EUMVA|nr:hypothetical protein EVAR_26108_1 [Eumeta japonica]
MHERWQYDKIDSGTDDERVPKGTGRDVVGRRELIYARERPRPSITGAFSSVRDPRSPLKDKPFFVQNLRYIEDDVCYIFITSVIEGSSDDCVTYIKIIATLTGRHHFSHNAPFKLCPYGGLFRCYRRREPPEMEWIIESLQDRRRFENAPGERRAR